MSTKCSCIFQRFHEFVNSETPTSSLPVPAPASKASGRKIDAVTTPPACSPPISQRSSAEPASKESLPGVATPEPSSSEHRDKAASAADERARQALKRGIGDLDRVAKMRKRSESFANQASASSGSTAKAAPSVPMSATASSSAARSSHEQPPTTLPGNHAHTPVRARPAQEELAVAAHLAGPNGARELNYRLSAPPGDERVHRGLNNLGSTCYGNALLFSLTSLPTVRCWLREHVEDAVKTPLHDSNTCALCMLARDAARLTAVNGPACFAPEVMQKRVIWNRDFAGTRQQDANEAFQALMNECDETDASALYALPAHRDVPRADFARSAARLSTPYNQIFANLQTIRVTCSACAHVTERYERANSHELALDDATNLSLPELLPAHLAHETLDESYRCDGCGVRGTCAIRTLVQQWQRVLMINLKRFAFDRNTRRPAKVGWHIR